MKKEQIRIEYDDGAEKVLNVAIRILNDFGAKYEVLWGGELIEYEIPDKIEK